MHRVAGDGFGLKAAVVIDVGCARYGGDYSIERLIHEFQPGVLIGYDPNGTNERYVDDQHGTAVSLFRAAVWTKYGSCDYLTPGLGGYIRGDSGATLMCDVADVVRDCASLYGGPLVLKLDCEGSEYGILERLIEDGSDRLVDLAWVEWHGPDRQPYRSWIEANWKGGKLVEWPW